jgi:PTS system ascorbate-specific IIA component
MCTLRNALFLNGLIKRSFTNRTAFIFPHSEWTQVACRFSQKGMKGVLIKNDCTYSGIFSRSKAMSHLAKWLNNEKIQYVESVADWQEALVIAGRPLLSEGAISQDYIDAIIQQKEEIGPFFVIAPQIAMPHARPEQGAHKLGLSIVLLGTAVKFDSEENDPVKAIFMFAAPDSNSHIEMISELAEVLSDEAIMAQLFRVTSKEALITILSGV